MDRTVLIVDDSDAVAQSLALALETVAGIKVIVANHSFTALRFFNSGAHRIAVLITDLNLPDVDGFELIHRIRQLSGYESIPVIMITANEYVSGQPRPGERMPDAIFRKPFSVREVCRAVQHLLQ